MAKVCATCGAPADDDAMFCIGCGGRELYDASVGGGYATGGVGLLCECGAPLEPGDAFCTMCGRAVATVSVAAGGRTCPSGHPVEDGDEFCTVCGLKVGDGGGAGGGVVVPVDPSDGGSGVRVFSPPDDSEMREFFREAGGL